MNDDLLSFRSTEQMLDRMQADKIPGVSIAVINDGELAWTGGYGVLDVERQQPVTRDTLFQACSISKPVCAMAALHLVQEGLLDLDEDVNRKLVSWQVPENEFTRDKKVTLRRLLTHTAGLTVSGFRGYAFDEPMPKLNQILDGSEPANSEAIRVDILPGTQWRYSGGGYTVLQQLLIDVTGQPLPELMHELVLKKLAMDKSTYTQPLPRESWSQAACGHDENGTKINGNWFTYPEMAAAGLWTTPSDLARVAMELQSSRAGKSNRVLSTTWTHEMLTGQLTDFPEEMRQRYQRDIRNQGLGFRLEDAGSTMRFSHHGGNVGYSCFMVGYCEIGQGAVVMTNSDNGFEFIQEVVRSIAREYAWVEQA